MSHCTTSCTSTPLRHSEPGARIRVRLLPGLVGVWMVAGAVFVAAGCQSANDRRVNVERPAHVKEALKAPLDPDIVRVATYYVNNPFVSFDEAGDPNPEGLKLVYYAVSGKTGQGAYGDGLIRFKMYRIARAKGEEPVGELVKTWEFTPVEALGWRVARKSSLLGWPYQFSLNWGDVDVYGREIRLVPEFERRDGLVVRGSPKDLRVPQRKMSVRLSEDS